MIVGLKYVGASDGFPTRISVGDTVRLRLEGSEVSAYHKDRKVGYLAPEKRRMWNSLRPSARGRARVVGEILDEDGNIAGLDVEIPASSTSISPSVRQARTSFREPPKTESSSRSYRAGLGLAVLLSSIAVMGYSSSTGPDRFAALEASVSGAAQVLGTANIVPLKSPAAFEPGIDSEQEMRRQVQLASVHRLAEDIRRKQAQAELKLEAEAKRAQGLKEALAQALQESLRQLKRIEDLEQQARLAATEREEESRKLNREIAALQQKIADMAVAKLKVEETARETALREINDRELVRHRNRLTAWMVMNRVDLLTSALKNKAALERAKTEERAVSVSQETRRQPEKNNSLDKSAPAEKSSRQAEEVQIKKKANFSRYAQENEELGGPVKR
jgi:hypothetical protein